MRQCSARAGSPVSEWAESGVHGLGPGCPDSDLVYMLLVFFARVDLTSGLTSSVVAFLPLYRPLVVLELNDWNPFASNLACGGQHSTQI